MAGITGIPCTFKGLARVALTGMTESDAEDLADLPPSAKLVFKVLEYDGPMTQKQIVQESMLSARTVRYALERLEGIDVVEEDVYFADARQNLYEIVAPEEVGSAEESDTAAADD